MATMMAAVIHQHGGPDAVSYEPIERREPGAGELRVRVAACGLNALDVFVRRGMPGVDLPLPHISGGDVAGWVEAAGDPADEHLVGSAVLIDPLVGRHALGEHLWGGLAESVVVPAANALVLPAADRETMRRYAALPIAYGTAHRMLVTRGQLQPGETLLVLGAAGGVGVACVQFAARIGARVIACSSSEEKLEHLRALGAAETINTSAGLQGEAGEAFLARVRELTGGRWADVVVDYVGRDTWTTSVRATRRLTGRLLTCGASSGFEAVTDLRYVWTREIAILGANGWTREDLTTIAGLVGDGELDPVIHGVFPLSRVHEAFAELDDRRVFGKVIVEPDGAWPA